jgi:Spy/CpxP family protein refolding chaperone
MNNHEHTRRETTGGAGGFFRSGLAAALTMTLALAAVAIQPAMAGINDGLPPQEESPREDEIRETIEIYMLAKMKRALALSRGQEEQMVPLVQALSETRREFAHQRRIAVGQLRALTRDPEAEDEEFKKVLARMHESERVFHDSEGQAHKAIQSILTPRQQARFMFFQERFQSDMQRRLRRMRETRGPGHRRQGRDRSEPERRRRDDGR